MLVLTVFLRCCDAEENGENVGKLRVILIAFLAAWLINAAQIHAGTLDNPIFTDENQDYDLPPADLAGWFLTFDPSTQWTTQSNIATMESWLAVVEEIAANPSLLEQFNGFGMADAPPAVWAWVTSNQLPQGQQQEFVPEPATLGLLGGSLLTLGFCIRKRARRRNTNSTHGSLRRPD